jgi:[citrate (pro-3S)-lyase] ligase
MFSDFQVNQIDISEKKIREEVIKLLQQNDLSIDTSLELMIGVFDAEKLIATGGIKANTLRCIAVDKKYQGGKALNMLMSELIKLQYRRNINDIFLFTKPSAKNSFEFMGFYVVEEIDGSVVLMENRPHGLKEYLTNLSKLRVEGNKISAIVMNGNPFTLGHRYLIERAARESDHLHVFVLSSEESTFPYEVRMNLINEGTKDIKNLTIHKGGDYIISNATFPSYFIKEKSDILHIHTMLDAKIFGKYIAPCLGINRRYVGEEPYCETTNMYNQTLKKLLPKYGIKVIEISRKTIDDVYISASNVRSFIAKGEIDKVKSLVPNSTYSFLTTEEGQQLINKIKTSLNKRH